MSILQELASHGRAKGGDGPCGQGQGLEVHVHGTRSRAPPVVYA